MPNSACAHLRNQVLRLRSALQHRVRMSNFVVKRPLRRHRRTVGTQQRRHHVLRRRLSRRTRHTDDMQLILLQLVDDVTRQLTKRFQHRRPGTIRIVCKCVGIGVLLTKGLDDDRRLPNISCRQCHRRSSCHSLIDEVVAVDTRAR